MTNVQTVLARKSLATPPGALRQAFGDWHKDASHIGVYKQGVRSAYRVPRSLDGHAPLVVINSGSVGVVFANRFRARLFIGKTGGVGHGVGYGVGRGGGNRAR